MAKRTSVPARCRGLASSSAALSRSRCCTPRRSISNAAISNNPFSLVFLEKECVMRFISHVVTSALVVVALSSAHGLQAQTGDVSGHYQGTISSPAGEMSIQIDLTKHAKGEMIGTLTIPAQKLTGFPLTNVVVKGQDVAFDIATSGGGYFRGELAGSGISGEFSTQMGPFPLTLERAGEAQTFSTPASARVGKEIEGKWNGTLDVDGGMRVVVKFANQ